MFKTTDSCFQDTHSTLWFFFNKAHTVTRKNRRKASLINDWNYGVFRWQFFALCVFLGAYLLFQIEPLIGKSILPWFGGSPAVWTTCVLFFQLALLGGYAYAHLSLDRLQPTQQALLHIGLLALALITLPIAPSVNWKPDNSSNPTLYILLLLVATVGLPFFVLSATSPLLQAWFVRVCPNRSPYPLYALSNLGSFLALLSYPFAFEPFFKLSQQTHGWSLGFGVFFLLCSGLAYDFRRKAIKGEIIATPPVIDDEPLLSDRVSAAILWPFWLALSAITSTLLLAVTNQLCQDVASIPFLWVLPLSSYLLSFIFSFGLHRYYRRNIFLPAAGLGVAGLVSALYLGSKISLFWQVGIYTLGLFLCCVICHGELFRLRPQPSRLTSYYLAISIGSAVGGVFVSLLAPMIFPLYLEFHIGLFTCCLVTMLAIALDPTVFVGRNSRLKAIGAGSFALMLLAGYLIKHVYETSAAEKVIARNFYGILRVDDRDLDNPMLARRVLRHGAIDHGFQYLSAEKSKWPTAYYRPETGIGITLSHLSPPHNRRIGIVGLGVGTLLSYGHPSDYYRVYDINPKVVELALSYFTFLKDSQARYDIVATDARLALEREAPQQFDVLVLDAFSGDSIPMHLLTNEAMQLYRKHIRSDGVIAIHIANHYLDLKPLFRGWSEQEDYQVRFIREPASADDFGLYRSSWALISRNRAFLEQSAIALAAEVEEPSAKRLTWTDDFCNLFSLLK